MFEGPSVDRKPVTDAYPFFFWHERPNPLKRDAAGTATIEAVPYVTIRKPGDSSYKNTRRAVAGKWAPADAKQRDDELWPNEWAAFIETGKNIQTGTLLQNWGALSLDQVEEYQRSNIHTVEQLAGMPDHVAGKLGVEGMRQKIRAKAWLDAQSNPGGASKVMADQAGQIATLQEAVRKLGEDSTKLRVQFDDRQRSHDAARVLADWLADANKALGKVAREDIDAVELLKRANAGRGAIDAAILDRQIAEEGGDPNDQSDIGGDPIIVAGPSADAVDPAFAEEAKDAIPAPRRGRPRKAA